MTKTAQPTLIDQPPQADTGMVQQTPTVLHVLERLASNPETSVDTIRQLMELHERSTERASKDLFNAAMSKAQQEMRPVEADATNPQTRSKYATYNALDRKLRPIYTRHGFGLSFDTGEAPRDEWVRVLCYVTHAGGHSQTYHVDMPADGKGAKGGDVMTKTHAVGAAMSYGMRYLLKMIFNVAVGEDDRDGNEGGYIESPDGYDDWLSELAEKANEGLPALQRMWKVANEDAELRRYAAHLTRTEPQTWNELKIRAAKVPA